MRSYGQYCALARSLDVIGDRWTLLIVRELFARDSRYSDLKEALQGIATNLLADRLRHLQSEGLVEAYEAPPPIRATVYRLTARGRELGPVLRALVRWGTPLLDSGRGNDAFRPQWMMLAVPIMFSQAEVADVAPLVVGVDTGGEPITLEVSDRVTASMGNARSPDVSVQGDPEAVYTFLSGDADAETVGVVVDGAEEAVQRLRTLVGRARPPVTEPIVG